MTVSQTDLDVFVETALTCCGDCRDYHLVRAYQLASGARLGPASDGPILAELLDQTLPRGGTVLIAGSADAGQLQFVHQTVGARAHRIVVADRCDTPLAMCRRFASAAGLSVDTVRADFTRELPKGPFDLVFAHIITRFIPATERVAFLRRVAASLAIGGHLVVVELSGTRSGGGYREGLSRKVMEGLAANGMILRYPDELREALARIEAAPREPARNVANLAALVREAGLVVERSEIDVGTAAMGKWGRQFVLASRSPISSLEQTEAAARSLSPS